MNEEQNYIERPPLGIVPKFVVLRKRKEEILDGFYRFAEVNCEIPVEWLEELNEIMKWLKEDEDKHRT